MSSDIYNIGNITGSQGIAVGPGARAEVIYMGPSYPRHNYRSAINHLIEFYSETFVGRISECRRLLDFSAQQEPGYLLVEAPAGYGKTALIARLIRHRENHIWPAAPALLYFFVRQGSAHQADGSHNTATTFLQAVNSQLLDLLELEGGVPENYYLLHNQFASLWARAIEQASPERPLLLLVDGLDEMATGTATVASELPGNLREYVHVIVSSRSNPEPLEQVSLEHPLRRATVEHLQAFTLNEIQELLRSYALTADKIAAFAPRMRDLTKGEPLMARYVAQDLKAKGESALQDLETSPPVNVEDYFRRQFKYLDDSTEGDLTWDILGLLTITHGSISRSEIAETLGIPQRKVRKALDPVRRFLLGIERVELMHPQFRKVLVEDISELERQDYRNQILAWCHRYQDRAWPDDTPDYILQYYAKHLADLKDRDSLYALLSRSWMERKLDHFRSDRYFTEDLKLVIDVAKIEPTNWPKLFASCLLYANLSTLATNVPPEILVVLAMLGEESKALDYAGLITDLEQRSRTYYLIARGLSVQKQLASVQRVLAFALEAAQTIVDVYAADYTLKLVVWELCSVAKKFAQAGQVERAQLVANQALEAAQSIKDAEARAEKLCVVAQKLFQVGQVERAQLAVNQAIEAAQDYRVGYSKAEILCSVVEALVQIGQMEQAQLITHQALQTAQAIGNAELKAGALSYVVEALIQIGQVEQAKGIANQALKAVQTSEQSEYRAGRLSRVAEVLAQAGEFNQALEAAQLIEDGEDKARALLKVIEAFAQAKQMEQANLAANQALRVAMGMENTANKVIALWRLAKILAEAGEMEHAKSVANQLLTVAQALEDAKDSAEALDRAVGALAKADEMEQAKLAVNQALKAAQAIRGREDRAKALDSVAYWLAEVGQMEQAKLVAHELLETNQSITDAKDRAWALFRVASVLAQAEQLEQEQARLTFSQVLEALPTIEEWFTRADIILNMTKMLIQAGQAEQVRSSANQALASAKTVEAEWSKARMLSRVAMALSEAGQGTQARAIANQALALAQAIADKESRTRTLIAAAYALFRVGDWEKAKVAFDQALVLNREDVEEQFRTELRYGNEQSLTQIGMIKQMLESAPMLIQMGEFILLLQIVDDQFISETLYDEAIRMVQARKIKEAVEAASTILDGWSRARALRAVTQTLIQDYTPNQVLEIIHMIRDGEIRAIMLSSAALALARAGKIEYATSAANHAVEIFGTGVVSDHWVQNRLSREVARAQVLVKHPEFQEEANYLFEMSLSLKAPAEYQEEQIRSHAFTDAEAIARDIDEGLKPAVEPSTLLDFAQITRDDVFRAMRFSAVVQALIRASKFNQALVAAKGIELVVEKGYEADKFRAEALRNAAVTLFHDEPRETALHAYAEIVDNARFLGRPAVFCLIEGVAHSLAAIDQGKTLRQIYEAMQEVDSWFLSNS